MYNLIEHLGRQSHHLCITKIETSYGTTVVRNFGSNPYNYGVSWRKYSVEEDNFAILKAQTGGPTTYDSDTTTKYRIGLWNELLPRILNISNVQTIPDNTGVKGMQLTTGKLLNT